MTGLVRDPKNVFWSKSILALHAPGAWVDGQCESLCGLIIHVKFPRIGKERRCLTIVAKKDAIIPKKSRCMNGKGKGCGGFSTRQSPIKRRACSPKQMPAACKPKIPYSRSISPNPRCCIAWVTPGSDFSLWGHRPIVSVFLSNRRSSREYRSEITDTSSAP